MIFQNPAVIIIPLISASIGWFTNYIAIKMLFYPRVPRRFLGLTLHGVFPKRQNELARKLGELFAEKLGVQEKISTELNKKFDDLELKNALTIKINELAKSFIKAEVPFLAAFASDELIGNLSVRVAGELASQLKERLESGARELAGDLDVKLLVQKQIEDLDVETLEELLQSLLKQEFRFIELSGAFLGFFIGCIQVLLSFYIFS